MKKIYSYYLSALFGVLSMLSCEKEPLITYAGERNLYFSNTGLGSNTDSIEYNFGLLPQTELNVNIPVYLMGVQLTENTPYEIIVDNDRSTAVAGRDYEISTSHQFRSNSIVDTLPLKIYRTEGMQAKALLLDIELKPNDVFKNLFNINTNKTRSRRLRVFFSDIVIVPTGWVTTSTAQGADYYFGPFSQKKFLLICQLYPAWPPSRMITSMVGNKVYFGNLLNNYLKAQKAAGKTVYEKNGEEMKAGVFYQ